MPRAVSKFDVSLLTTRQIKNLIKIAERAELKIELQEELARRERERRALFTHQQRGRERAKAEGRLRHAKEICKDTAIHNAVSASIGIIARYRSRRRG